MQKPFTTLTEKHSNSKLNADEIQEKLYSLAILLQFAKHPSLSAEQQLTWRLNFENLSKVQAFQSYFKTSPQNPKIIYPPFSLQDMHALRTIEIALTKKLRLDESNKEPQTYYKHKEDRYTELGEKIRMKIDQERAKNDRVPTTTLETNSALPNDFPYRRETTPERRIITKEELYQRDTTPNREQHKRELTTEQLRKNDRDSVISKISQTDPSDSSPIRGRTQRPLVTNTEDDRKLSSDDIKNKNRTIILADLYERKNQEVNANKYEEFKREVTPEHLRRDITPEKKSFTSGRVNVTPDKSEEYARQLRQQAYDYVQRNLKRDSSPYKNPLSEDVIIRGRSSTSPNDYQRIEKSPTTIRAVTEEESSSELIKQHKYFLDGLNMLKEGIISQRNNLELKFRAYSQSVTDLALLNRIRTAINFANQQSNAIKEYLIEQS
jgi:hypothetical protein